MVFQAICLYFPVPVVGDYPVADIMFSKSTDNGVNWSTPSSILPANHPLKALWNNAPRISTSGGKFVIVWSSGWKIYSSVSSDAGATWVAPVLVNSDIDSTIYSNTDFTSQYTYKDGDAYDPLHPAGMAPEIQRGANSEWLCTFHQQKNGGNYRSLVYKSSDDGTLFLSLFCLLISIKHILTLHIIV